MFLRNFQVINFCRCWNANRSGQLRQGKVVMLSLLENESGACRGSTSFPMESFEKGVEGELTPETGCVGFAFFFLNS